MANKKLEWSKIAYDAEGMYVNLFKCGTHPPKKLAYLRRKYGSKVGYTFRKIRRLKLPFVCNTQLKIVAWLHEICGDGIWSLSGSQRGNNHVKGIGGRIFVVQLQKGGQGLRAHIETDEITKSGWFKRHACRV